MAKQRERIATGLTIAQITKMTVFDLQSYTPKQQREIVSRLGSAVNKRLKTFEKSGIETPATIKLGASGGKISVRGKSGKELLDEFFRARTFLKSKTSTKRGFKQLQKDIQTEISTMDNLGEYINYSSNIMKHAFNLYDVLKDTSPEILSNMDKYKVTEKIAAMIYTGKDSDLILGEMTKILEDEYLKEQRKFKEDVKGPENPLDRIPKRYERKSRRR